MSFTGCGIWLPNPLCARHPLTLEIDLKKIDKTARNLKYPPVVILKDTRESNGWFTAIICGRWVEAKVYDEPSEYGIDNGRVSKMSIAKTAHRNPHSNFFDQMCYHWERGPDFKRRGTTMAFVRDIVSYLEELPKVG